MFFWSRFQKKQKEVIVCHLLFLINFLYISNCFKFDLFVTHVTIQQIFKIKSLNHVLLPLSSKIQQTMPTLKEIRERAAESLRHIRTDHKRALNPTPYKVNCLPKLSVIAVNMYGS